MRLPLTSLRRLAWLGIFSVLMIAVAPTLSASISGHSAVSAAGHADDGHEAMRITDAQQRGGMGENERCFFSFCGYCTLFQHTPPLVNLALTLFLAQRQRSETMPQTALRAVSQAVYPPYRTRAPPAIACFS